MSVQEKMRALVPPLLLAAVVILLGRHPANWMHIQQEAPKAFYDYRPLSIPASAQAVGDFNLFIPAGGWQSVASERAPMLQAEAWVGPARAGNRVLGWAFLFDGKELQPATAANFTSIDPVKEFDHLELYDAGWEVTLALPPVVPGRHTLALEATLADQSRVVIKQVVLE